MRTRRLSRNDPTVAGVYLDTFTSPFQTIEQWSENVCRPISNSIYLRKSIFSWGWGEGQGNRRLKLLFQAISENRSIAHLELHNLQHSAVVNIFPILASFFEHNQDLRCIEIHSSEISSRVSSLISALSKTNRLERINLFHNEIGDEKMADIISTLNTTPGLHYALLDLCLGGNGIGLKSCKELHKLLNNTGCKINHLDLKCNQLNDECMNILVGSLAQNTTIKSIDLNHQELVTPSGWCTFIPSLSKPACSLNKLFIGDNEIGDEGATCLEDTLMLYNVSLKELDVSGCDIDDVGAYEIFQGLAQNSTLKKLKMTAMLSISPEAWATCFQVLLDAFSELVVLDFSQNNIDDEGSAMLIFLLAESMTTVSSLDVTGNSSITSDGWCLYSELFESTASSQLTELRIGSVDILSNQPNIDNDTFIDIVYSLSYNSSTRLEILTFDSAEVSASGWDALASVLCNDSSIDEIAYESNHILREINGLVLPGNIENLLSINSIEDKSEVKRQKLLLYFSADAEKISHLLGPMVVEVLPSAIAWIGRNRVGLSVLYNVVRTMPSIIPATLPDRQPTEKIGRS